MPNPTTARNFNTTKVLFKRSISGTKHFVVGYFNTTKVLFKHAPPETDASIFIKFQYYKSTLQTFKDAQRPSNGIEISILQKYSSNFSFLSSFDFVHD